MVLRTKQINLHILIASQFSPPIHSLDFSFNAVYHAV